MSGEWPLGGDPMEDDKAALEVLSSVCDKHPPPCISIGDWLSKVLRYAPVRPRSGPGPRTDGLRPGQPQRELSPTIAKKCEIRLGPSPGQAWL